MKCPYNILSLIANITLWGITLFLSYSFIASCYAIFSGDDAVVELFNKLGGSGLRYTIATLEGLGAILVLLPRTLALGASLLVIATIGIITAEMSSLGGVPEHPVLMLVLGLVLLVARQYFPAKLPLLRCPRPCERLPE